MESHQLEKAIHFDPCLSTLRHTAILAADELSLVETPGAYIVNTDPRNLPGQHWIALYVSANGTIEVFDPLGYHPRRYLFLENYLRGRRFTYNGKRWQQRGTSTCGQHCLFYLYHICRGWTLSQLNHFYWNSDLNRNERLVVRFVGHYFCIPCSCKWKKYQCSRLCD